MLYFTLTQFVQSTSIYHLSTSGSYRSSLIDRIPAFLIRSGSWQHLEAKNVAISPKQHSLRKLFRELWEGKPKSHHWLPFPEVPTENEWIFSVCVCVCFTWGWSWYVANIPGVHQCLNHPNCFAEFHRWWKSLSKAPNLCIFDMENETNSQYLAYLPRFLPSYRGNKSGKHLGPIRIL